MRFNAVLLSWLATCALASPPAQLVFQRPPLSRNPESCPGYRVIDATRTERGHRLRLRLDGPACNAYGLDDQYLVVHVEYQTEDRLRVHIYDEDKTNVEVPEEALPYPHLPKTAPQRPALAFAYSESPFTFNVTRRATGEVIWSSHPRLIFEDQFIQLTSDLPINANIYGLGEVASSSGFRRDPNATRQGMWAHDALTPVDANLYGAHPVYLEYRTTGSHAVFLRNSHAMDVLLEPGSIEYRAIGGTFDLYFQDGPTPLEAIQNYIKLIGLPQMQPKWALGFHLCRWGYSTLEAVKEVVERMREAEIPHEVQWLDIDYMRNYEDFTVEAQRFPPDELSAFIDDLHNRSMELVPIIDLGIAVGENDAYKSGLERNTFLRNYDDTLYTGKVWPGYTTFPDFFAPNTSKWWLDRFAAFHDIFPFSGIWLDMNEASTFCNGGCEPEGWAHFQPTAESDGLDFPPYWPLLTGDGMGLIDKSIRPSAEHANGLLEYNVHNLMGLMQSRATNDALRQIQFTKRPFLLSRSTAPGSGTVAAHWLGDNLSTWASLKMSIQGVLQFGLFGIPMVGADVCGFAGNTTEELCARWMQMASLVYPFMRNHNAINSISQEPFLWDSVSRISRDALRFRLTLMPYLYTLLREAATEGTPIVRALLWEFPDQPELALVDTQIMLGSALLVTPVLDKGVTDVSGTLPGNETWFDLGSARHYSPGWHSFSAPLGVLPVHLRSGSILLLHSEPGLTIKETEQYPFMLYIAVDSGGKANGKAYFDDGISFEGESKTVRFEYAHGCLSWCSQGAWQIAQRVTSVRLFVGALAGDVNDSVMTLDRSLDLNDSNEFCWQ